MVLNNRGYNGGSAVNQNGYRKDYNRNQQGEYGGKYEQQSGGAKYQGDAKYDNGKYNNAGKFVENGKYENGKYSNGNTHNGAANNGKDQVLSPNQITSLEKTIASVQTDMNTALTEATAKENEKFDLIFSILIELQRRQAQLEESVKSLKAQYGVPASAQGSQQNLQQVSQMSPQMQQLQIHMNQQYAGQQQVVINADGSQTYYTPVVMAVPATGQNMSQYGMPNMMMSPTGQMQGMQMQYVSQSPTNQNSADWNGDSWSGAGSVCNGQPVDASSQDSTKASTEDAGQQE
mmetsp:Transcript_117560/g.252703  ORF Transcript_117560/g.252703 Transcript_117560/m.252703 type:complete len:290 (-) Transcript_117560:118-987(-)